jgi:hypothetical protein
MAFFNRHHGLASSDPVSGEFPILATHDSGGTWELVEPIAQYPMRSPTSLAGRPARLWLLWALPTLGWHESLLVCILRDRAARSRQPSTVLLSDFRLNNLAQRAKEIVTK